MNGVGESRTSASISGQRGMYGHCQRNGNIIYNTDTSMMQIIYDVHCNVSDSPLIVCSDGATGMAKD